MLRDTWNGYNGSGQVEQMGRRCVGNDDTRVLDIDIAPLVVKDGLGSARHVCNSSTHCVKSK